MPIYKMNGKKDGKQKYRVRINYVDDLGHPRQLERVTYGNEEAKQLERELNYRIKSKAEAPEAFITLRQLFQKYMETKKHEVRESSYDKTRRMLERYVLEGYGDVKLSKLTPALLGEWKQHINDLEGIKSITTRQNIFGEFRAMLNYAVKMEYMQKNPLLKVGNFKAPLEFKKEMDFYTADEFKRFISAAYEHCTRRETEGELFDWNYYVFFCLAFYMGMRKGEIYALRWCDVNKDEIRITRSLNQQLRGGDRITPPKNASSVRTIQIPKPLKKILADHKKRCMILGDFNEELYICGGKKSLRNTTVSNMNQYFSQLAGLKKIRIHDYRHSHASLLAQNGISIHEIARRLGHSNITQTLETYSHLYPGESERALSILDEIEV